MSEESIETHTNWVEVVDELVGDSNLPPKASAWLYREAYYDGYGAEEAIGIALDARVEFRVWSSGWVRPIPNRELLKQAKLRKWLEPGAYLIYAVQIPALQHAKAFKAESDSRAQV